MWQVRQRLDLRRASRPPVAADHCGGPGVPCENPACDFSIFATGRSKDRGHGTKPDELVTRGRQSCSKLHIVCIPTIRQTDTMGSPRCRHNAPSERVCDLVLEVRGVTPARYHPKGPRGLASPTAASQRGGERRICGLRSPQHMSGVRTLMWTLKHSALHDCLGFLIAGALPDHR